MKWSEVAATDEFQELDPAGREQWRNEYFNEVVAPHYDETALSDVRAEFDTDTAPQPKDPIQLPSGMTVPTGPRRLAGGPESIVPDMGPKMSPAPGEPQMSRGPTPPGVLDRATEYGLGDVFKSVGATWGDSVKRMMVSGAQQFVEAGGYAPPFMTPGEQKNIRLPKEAREAGGKVLSGKVDVLDQIIKENTPQLRGQPALKYFQDVATVTRDMIGALGAGALAKSPYATLALMGLQADLNTYHNYRKAGHDPELSQLSSLYVGAVEAYTEAIPVGMLFKFGKPLLRKVLMVTVGEGLQESASSLLTSAWDAGILKEDMTLGEALRAAGYEGAIGLGAGGVIGGTVAAGEKLSQGVTQGQKAGKILQDLVASQSIDPALAAKIAEQVSRPVQPEGQMGGTEQQIGERVGPAPDAAYVASDIKTEHTKAQADTASEAAYAAREAEVGAEQARAEKDFEAWSSDATSTAEKITQSKEGRDAEREVTAKPETAMEQAFAAALTGKKTGDLLKAGTEDNQESRQGPPLNEHGLIPAYHYSQAAGLTALDASRYGTGLAGAEVKRKRNNPKTWIDRSYFYLGNEHRKERSLGKQQYRTELAPEELYDLGADPEGYYDQAEEMIGVRDPTLVEKLVHDAGYRGFWIDNPQLGPSAGLFGQTPVKHVLSPAALIREIDSEGGFTLDTNTGERPKKGFAVGIGKESRSPAARFTPGQVEDYVRANAKDLYKADHYLGGWKTEEGDIALDVSRVFPTEKEAMALAIKLGEDGIQDLSKSGDEGYIPVPKEQRREKLVEPGGDEITTKPGHKETRSQAVAVKDAWAVFGELSDVFEVPFTEPYEAAHDNRLAYTGMAPKLHEFTRDRANMDTLSRLTAPQEKLLGRALWDLNTAGMPAITTEAIRAFMGVQAPVLGRHTYINANAGNGGYVAIGNIAHMGMAGSEQDQIVRLGTAAVIAHELGHAIDNGHTPAGQTEQYHTSSSPLFAFNPAGRGKLGGPVLNELIEAFLQDKSSLSKILWYPFNQVFERGAWEALVDQRSEADAIGLIEKEAFAQLFSMYYTLGRTESGLAELKKAMPRSIQLMEDIHEALEGSTTLAKRDQRVSEAFRSTPRVSGKDTGELVGKSPESIEGRKARSGPGKVQGRKLQAGQRTSGDAAARTGESLTGPGEDLPTNIQERALRRAQALSTTATLEGTETVKIAGTGPHGRVVGPDIARAMNARVRSKAWAVKPKDYSPRAVEYVAQSLAEEASYQLGRNDSAIGWYEHTLAQALNTLAKLHPELTTRQDADTVFKLILAITSNGTRVTENFAIAERGYAGWKETGRIPENLGTGVEMNTINAHLAKANELIDAYGLAGTREFLSKPHTVRELRALGAVLSGELIGTSMLGSNMFGPKIGTFYANLTGNYNPVTMDRWFLRTVRRTMGHMLDPKSKTGLYDAAKTGTEREWMRTTVARTKELLAEAGHDITTADLQALLWYHEKALFATLRGRKAAHEEQQQEDYATAAQALLDAKQREPAGQDDVAGRESDTADDVQEAPLLEGTPDDIDEMPTRANFTVPDETRVDKAARIFQDKFQRLYKTQRAIREAGGKILMDTDPYAAEERMHGKIENDFRTLENEYVEPIADALAEAKIPIEDLDTYLIARHAPERNEYIATIRDDMPDAGSGFTTAEAVAEQTRLEKLHPKIGTVAAQVYDMLRLKRKLMNRAGLISHELLDAWRDGYQFYVPLKGWAEDSISPNHPRVGTGLSIKGKEFKAALGRKSRAASPTMQSIMDTTEAIVRARKNEVGQYLYELVQDNPNPAFWEIFEPGKPDMAERLENGVVVNRPVAMHMSSEYFGVKYEGKQYYIKLKDPLLAQAMQNLGVEKQNTVVRVMGSAVRFLSSVNTSLNPEFIVSNFSRDIQTAVYNVLAETDLHDAKVGGEKIANKMVKDTPKAIKSMYRVLRGATPTTEFERMAIDFMADGAKTGYFDMKDIETQKRHVEALVTMAKGGALGKAMKAGKATAQFIEDVNSAVENGVRLSAYVHARKALEARGMDEDTARKKASHLSKNLTVNFNRRGEMSTVANSLFMFFNASVQGSAQFARTMVTLKQTPDGRKLNIAQKAAVAMTSFAYMLALLNRAMSDDDDDGVSFYDGIPSHIKERNLIVMHLNGQTYTTIPLPYGYNVFHVFGTAASDVIHGPKKLTSAALEMALAILGSFNPVGVSEDKDPGLALVKTATPTLFTPAVEIYTNSNFFGAPVWREDRFNRRTPDSALSFYTTKPHFKAIASWLNQVTGGSQWERGAIDVSPDSLEHWFDFSMGGAGAFIDRTAGAAWKLKEGIPVKTREIPFMRRLQGEPNEFRSSGLYYEREDIALAKLDAVKNMEPSDRAEFRKQNKEFLQIAVQFKATDKRLGMLRKRRNRLRVKEGISEADRVKQLEDIQKKMNVQYNRMNLRWNTSIEKN